MLNHKPWPIMFWEVSFGNIFYRCHRKYWLRKIGLPDHYLSVQKYSLGPIEKWIKTPLSYYSLEKKWLH